MMIFKKKWQIYEKNKRLFTVYEISHKENRQKQGKCNYSKTTTLKLDDMLIFIFCG